MTTYYKCNACNGTGTRPEFARVYNGVCFTCNGNGRLKTGKQTKQPQPVPAKQYVRKTQYGFELHFLFWGDGEVQVFKETPEDTEGVRWVDTERARDLWRNPQSF